MSRPIELLSVIALLMWSTIASAHHGRAGYDLTSVVELEGDEPGREPGLGKQVLRSENEFTIVRPEPNCPVQKKLTPIRSLKAVYARTLSLIVFFLGRRNRTAARPGQEGTPKISPSLRVP